MERVAEPGVILGLLHQLPHTRRAKVRGGLKQADEAALVPRRPPQRPQWDERDGGATQQPPQHLDLIREHVVAPVCRHVEVEGEEDDHLLAK